MARAQVDYMAVAMAIARRHFSTVYAFAQDDIRQECAMLAWEAESRGRIQVGHGSKRKMFGTGSKSERMGLRSFSRAAYARLYRMARNYGYRRFRNANSLSGKA